MWRYVLHLQRNFGMLCHLSWHYRRTLCTFTLLCMCLHNYFWSYLNQMAKCALRIERKYYLFYIHRYTHTALKSRSSTVGYNGPIYLHAWPCFYFHVAFESQQFLLFLSCKPIGFKTGDSCVTAIYKPLCNSSSICIRVDHGLMSVITHFYYNFSHIYIDIIDVTAPVANHDECTIATYNHAILSVTPFEEH